MKRIFVYLLLITIFAGFLLLTNCNDKDKNGGDQEMIGWAAGESVGGFGTILHTKDGGVTWERQGDASMIPDTYLQDIRAVDKDVVWAVGEPEGELLVILKTEDGGKTWIRQGLENGLQDVSLSGICPVSRNVCWAAGYKGTILKTLDGGNNWTVIRASPGYMGRYQMIAALDENHAWATGEGDTVAMIHYTSDGGLTWERQGTDSLTTGNMPNALIDIHAENVNYVWAVGPSQAIYTLNGGKTWINKRTPIGFIHNNGVCIVNDQIVWVATDNNLIFKLSQLNGDWNNQTSPAWALTAMYLGVTAIDENRAWMTSSSVTGAGQIINTVNGGATWVIQQIPEEVSLRRITFVGGKR